MIRLRGVPISDDEAAELARRLRQHAAKASSIADRVDRALALGSGLIATSPSEAGGLLAVLDEWDAEVVLSERLLEARESLVEMLAT